MPRQPDTTYQLDFASDAVSFDIEKFDELIRSHGVEMVHWRAMRCPVGMVDLDDIRRPHEHHENCSNGFIYTLAGTVTVGFLSNSNNPRFHDAGVLDGATVQIVIPRFYDDHPETRVELCPFDRMYLKEESITVPNWETFSAHVTGVDRLQFPVVKVTDLVDALGQRYKQDADFEVRGGRIYWGNRQPGVDPKTNKGRVCAVRYSYRPYWYVKQLVHEVRVSRVLNEYTGDREIQQMPQSAILQREYHFEKEQNDPQAPQSPRHGQAPPSGAFGPR
jgi:hypothetical protein